MNRSLLVAASLFLVSCSDPTSPAEDLLVSVSVTPSVIRAGGDAATVVVTVRNRGSRAHSLPNHCVPRFTVAKEDGSIVGPGPIVCIAIPFPPTKLGPGDELTITNPWQGDGFADSTEEPPGLLPRGTYLLRGSVSVEGEDAPVTSPPVAIMIEE